jgi:hypothetical protein
VLYFAHFFCDFFKTMAEQNPAQPPAQQSGIGSVTLPTFWVNNPAARFW